MESIVERNKDAYYLALRRTQQTIRKKEQNWESWLAFFLKTMAKQKDNLAEKVKEEQTLRAFLPALFTPDPGIDEDARRDHGQRNRRVRRRQPQYHQGACEEAGRTALSAAGRPRARRALHDQVALHGFALA